MQSNAQGPDLTHLAPERLLLIKPSSFGDVIHALPVLHGLRTRYPEAEIDWLINATLAPLLEGHPQISRLIVFDRQRFGHVGATRAFLGFVRGLRERRYDLVVDLQGLFRTGFLSWATGAPVRIGFRGAREGAWMFYTHRIGVDNVDAHAVDRNYLVAGLLGFSDVGVAFHLALSDPLRDQTVRLLRSQGIGESDCLIAVAPGARWETKAWPPRKFTETIDRLQSQAGVRCLLLGGPDERGLCNEIENACASKPVNLAGRTDVRQLAAAISHADIVLCHDSAAAHLAVAFDRPLVCLVGPTNPSRTGPYRRPEDVLRVDLDCAPCYLRKMAQCPYNHRCMEDLQPDLVVAALRSAMRRASPAHA